MKEIWTDRINRLLENPGTKEKFLRGCLRYIERTGQPPTPLQCTLLNRFWDSYQRKMRDLIGI